MGKGEVIVQLTAAGVQASDVIQMAGGYGRLSKEAPARVATSGVQPGDMVRSTPVGQEGRAERGREGGRAGGRGSGSRLRSEGGVGTAEGGAGASIWWVVHCVLCTY